MGLIVLYCALAALVSSGLTFFLLRKFSKPKIEYVVDEEFVNEVVSDSIIEARQEWEAGLSKDFLKLPIKIHSKSGKVDVKKLKKCEECTKKAESMGIDIKIACPDLDCDENEGEYTTESTFDYIRPQDVKGFLGLKGGTNIAFYDGTVIYYNLTEEEFLEKFSKFINII